MAYLLTPEHVSWSHWVSGESTSAVRFYQKVGGYGYTPASNPRWRQLAAALTNPNYRMNYDYQKTRSGQGVIPKHMMATDYFEAQQTFNTQLDTVMRRSASQVVSHRTRKGKSGDWKEQTNGLYAKCIVQSKTSSCSLPKLTRSTRLGSMSPN